jgi:predicted nuclease of predicted toxin-antitoxin system
VLRLAADENVDARVLRGLLLRARDLDVVRAQDAGLSGATDPQVLAWAAVEQRVLLSHDVRTMTAFAAERLTRGEPMMGLVILPQTEAIGLVLDALEELITSREANTVNGQILYLKL